MEEEVDMSTVEWCVDGAEWELDSEEERIENEMRGDG